MAHLDVKPDNVLAGAGCKYVLADFGCSKEVEADGCLSGACGTPLYMAPEQCSKQGFNTKADIYSVGVLMCVCALWHRDNMSVSQFVDRAKKLPKVIKAELRDFLEALTVQDPAKRSSAQQAMEHPFLAGMRVEDLFGTEECSPGEGGVSALLRPIRLAYCRSREGELQRGSAHSCQRSYANAPIC
ncbi:hypothetical protein GPECTOR_5g210 [Gonium pectorale]|uniref:Protein kinase domain-containing protein n=1 Tax=Gonium pectorale TaxID=33097 RepID=A0A150GWQ7_GONPE|nr:hypothetical protein GPECTOR_5g210 [Gonium pectorale]|eukprot:KXZ54108.1 hypothetical protein GPECTOR_5g210 [Gonium pectorale]